jgi:hypothetical protein
MASRTGFLTRSFRTRRARRSDRGSAFVIVLFALVLLTVFALALVSVSQSELQIGANERQIGRMFYAADAGSSIAHARRMVTKLIDPKTFVIPDTNRALGAGSIRDQVELSMLLPLLNAPCNLCEVNNASPTYDKKFERVNAGQVITAARVGIDAAGKRVPVGQRRVSLMLDLQPVEIVLEKMLKDDAMRETLKPIGQ